MKRFVALILAALTLVVVPTTTGTAAASGEWGHASAKSQPLKQGCHGYAFSYRIEAPGDEWMAEITLVNPNGRKIATQTYDSGAEARTGARAFRICSPSTKPGRHAIRLKITSYDGRSTSVRQEQPTVFRLTR